MRSLACRGIGLHASFALRAGHTPANRAPTDTDARTQGQPLATVLPATQSNAPADPGVSNWGFETRRAQLRASEGHNIGSGSATPIVDSHTNVAALGSAPVTAGNDSLVYYEQDASQTRPMGHVKHGKASLGSQQRPFSRQEDHEPHSDADLTTGQAVVTSPVHEEGASPYPAEARARLSRPKEFWAFDVLDPKHLVRRTTMQHISQCTQGYKVLAGLA